MKKDNAEANLLQGEENRQAPIAKSTANTSHNQIIKHSPAISYRGKAVKRRKRYFLFIIPLFILVLANFLYSVYLDALLTPQLKEMGLAEAQKEIQERINQEILKLCESGDISFDGTVKMQKNVKGEIISLEANTAELNRMRAVLVDRVSRAVNRKKSFVLSVPAGSLTSSSLLSWISLPVRVKYSPIGAVSGEILTEFTHSGVNQTKYSAMVEVRIQVLLLIPGENPSAQAVVRFPLGETIIVGDVPQYYGGS